MSLNGPSEPDPIHITADEVGMLAVLLVILLGCLTLITVFVANGAESVLGWLRA